MPFAPFPALGYLSDGIRTEGEMKTAFENWLLATQQTGGHGECRLVSASADPPQPGAAVDGRRLIVNNVAYELPGAGLTVDQCGPDRLRRLCGSRLGVSRAGWSSTSCCPRDHAPDPDSGIEHGRRQWRACAPTFVGYAYTNGASQFVAEQVISWFHRRRRTALLLFPSDLTTGSSTPVSLFQFYVPLFAHTTLQATMNVMLAAGATAASVVFEIYIGPTLVASSFLVVPPYGRFPVSLLAQQYMAVHGGITVDVRIYLPTAGHSITVIQGSQLLVAYDG